MTSIEKTHTLKLVDEDFSNYAIALIVAEINQAAPGGVALLNFISPAVPEELVL